MKIQKPPLALHLTETLRATLEFVKCLYFLATSTFPKTGNGQPVMVVPGIFTNDLATYVLRRFLKRRGYAVQGWELGTNLGDITDIVPLSEKVKSMHQQYGQPVTLIGWSLGGVYVREVAKKCPESVSQVITMGSPFAEPEAPNHVVWLFNLYSDFGKVDPAWKAQLPNPAPVKTTAIYSKKDGMVPWEACCEHTEDGLHQNCEVNSSHIGYPINPEVLRIIVAQLQAR